MLSSGTVIDVLGLNSLRDRDPPMHLHYLLNNQLFQFHVLTFYAVVMHSRLSRGNFPFEKIVQLVNASI